MKDQRIYAFYRSRRHLGPDEGGKSEFWLRIARRFGVPVQEAKAAVRREQEKLGR